jgi:hypothetical protein
MHLVVVLRSDHRRPLGGVQLADRQDRAALHRLPFLLLLGHLLPRILPQVLLKCLVALDLPKRLHHDPLAVALHGRDRLREAPAASVVLVLSITVEHVPQHVGGERSLADRIDAHTQKIAIEQSAVIFLSFGRKPQCYSQGQGAFFTLRGRALYIDRVRGRYTARERAPEVQAPGQCAYICNHSVTISLSCVSWRGSMNRLYGTVQCCSPWAQGPVHPRDDDGVAGPVR